MTETEILRNRIIDIVIRYSGIKEKDFYTHKPKAQYQSIRLMCMWIMNEKDIPYEEASAALDITFQNYYYHLRKIKAWKKKKENAMFFKMTEEIIKEVENENSELSLY